MSKKVKSIFGDLEILYPETATSQVSGNGAGDSFSILFDRAGVSLQSADQPLAEIFVVSFRVPVLSKKTITGFLQDIGLGVTCSKNTRIAMTFDLAGTTHHLEVPFGEDARTTSLEFKRFFSVQGLAEASSAGIGVPGSTEYFGSIFISVQRRTTADIALVSIDSLDIAAFLT